MALVAMGVGNGHSRRKRFEYQYDGPAVADGLQDHLIFLGQPLATDVIEGRGVHALIAERIHRLSGSVEDVPDNQMLVEINADIAYHVIYSL